VSSVPVPGPSGLRLLPLRKIEGFFAPAFVRSEKSAALAGRIANRKQVTMQIIQSLRRNGLRFLAAVLLLTPVLSGTTRAASSPTSASSPPTPAAPTANAKSTASSQTQATTASTVKPASSESAPASETAGTPQPLPTPQAPGQASLSQPEITKLPTIVVTAATREPQSPETTATTTTVLTHQYLQDAAFVDIPSALQQVPGLSVVTSGNQGAQTSVFIHGLDSNQTLVTVDGRRQAVGISGEDDNLANLTLDNVDQIEVVRTPTSSVNGGSAMGGVINIVTLSGRGLTQPVSSAFVEAGSFNTYRENIQSRGADGNFDYAVSATRQDSIFPALSTGDAANFTTGFTGQADQYRNSTLRGNFGYQLTPDVYVDLHSAYSNAYTSSPNEYVTPDPTASLLIEDWNLSPEIVAKVNDFYSTKFYYTHDQQRQADSDPFFLAQAEEFGFSPQGDLTRLQINTDSVDWQNDLQLAHNWTLTAGLQGDNRHDYEYDTGLGYRTFDEHDDNIGGFISSQWQPIDGLNVLNSGRYDGYSQFGGTFTWREAVSYVVAPTQTVVHASVARAFTPPPIQDRLVFYPNPFGANYYPNPGLAPETSLGWEAGAEQPLWDGRITPSATYFHNDLHNEIANAQLPSGDFMEENIGRATTQGVEVGLKLQPISTITVNLGYTYLDAIDNDTQLRLVRRPRNNLVFSGTWNALPALTFTLGGNWVVGRQDIEVDPPYGQVAAPDYFVLRASATYRINDHVSIWVRGENLTDRNYQPALGFCAASIACYGGIKVSF
jgi:vitamin B12 transporter